MRGMPLLAALAALPWLAGDAWALEAARRPVVVELFTSEGCSSCPPADALLSELVRARPDVLALAFHVTYWDRLGWPDPFALSEATARQRGYAARLGLESIYTPQLVVDGRRDVVGSDRAAVLSALRSAAGAVTPAVPLDLRRSGGSVRVTAGSGAGRGMLALIGYDSVHRTPVAHGENAGRVLTEANVVRSVQPLGDWTGLAVQREVAAPPGEHFAAILQAADGEILGAALLP